ncbi:MAG: GNAT family N-acetyltransferase, partial [Muribaculaceae bacterium]
MDSRTPVRLKGEGELCPRVAEAELREQMCRLWQEAFGDERDFVMHYLSRFSHSGNRLLRFDESGRLVAMMHMHPFTIGMKGVPGDEVAVRFEPEQGGLKGSRGAYVYGVATAKECRGRGIASEMLADA